MAKSLPPQGADIEIIDPLRSIEEPGALVPSIVRINGDEVAIPEDATVRISEISPNEAVTVTLTMFARSLSIRHERATDA